MGRRKKTNKKNIRYILWEYFCKAFHQKKNDHLSIPRHLRRSHLQNVMSINLKWIFSKFNGRDFLRNEKKTTKYAKSSKCFKNSLNNIWKKITSTTFMATKNHNIVWLTRMNLLYVYAFTNHHLSLHYFPTYLCARLNNTWKRN